MKGEQPEYRITEAYLEADKQLLVNKGFMGMGKHSAHLRLLLSGFSSCEGSMQI